MDPCKAAVRRLPPERPYNSPSVCTTPAVPGSLLAAVAPLLEIIDEAKAPSRARVGVRVLIHPTTGYTSLVHGC